MEDFGHIAHPYKYIKMLPVAPTNAVQISLKEKY